MTFKTFAGNASCRIGVMRDHVGDKFADTTDHRDSEENIPWVSGEVAKVVYCVPEVLDSLRIWVAWSGPEFSVIRPVGTN